jgi:hypothetical protein
MPCALFLVGLIHHRNEGGRLEFEYLVIILLGLHLVSVFNLFLVARARLIHPDVCPRTPIMIPYRESTFAIAPIGRDNKLLITAQETVPCIESTALARSSRVRKRRPPSMLPVKAVSLQPFLSFALLGGIVANPGRVEKVEDQRVL